MSPLYESRWKRIADRVFLIPARREGYILYAPLADYAALVNARTARLVRDMIAEKGKGKLPQEIVRALGHLSWLDESANAIIPAHRAWKFQPTSVTLFPTTRCNLGCIYCYADAEQGRDGIRMEEEVALSAIGLVSANAEKAGETTAGLGFHGGGEPFIERRFVERVIGNARMLCDQKGQKLNLTAATNASLGMETIRWVRRTFNALTVSCDGPENIHDAHRPFHNGSGSWKIIDRNVRMLRDSDVNIGIRATMSDLSAPCAAEIVSFFVESWGVKVIQFEILNKKGRGAACRVNPPDDETFLKAYIDAYETGKRLGARVDYSGTRIGGPHCSFCQVDGRSFSVTSDGYVTACFEVTGAQKDGAGTFLYGKYNPAKQKFEFDGKKIRKLRKLTVNEKSACAHCFCKWNCAGDCPAKSPEVIQYGTEAYRSSTSGRCAVNRALTAYLLEERLMEHDDDAIPTRTADPAVIEETHYETSLR